MARSPRPARVVLIIVALATGVLLIPLAPRALYLITHKRIEFDWGQGHRQVFWVLRWKEGPRDLQGRPSQIPDGEWVEYRAEGLKAVAGRYREARKDGRWVEYHPDGSLELYETYEGGTRVGVSSRWHESGILLEQKLHVGGTLVEHRQSPQLFRIGDFTEVTCDCEYLNSAVVHSSGPPWLGGRGDH